MSKFISIETNTTEYTSESLEAYMNAAVTGYINYCRSLPVRTWKRDQSATPASIHVFDYPSGGPHEPVKLREQRSHQSVRLSLAKSSVIHSISPMSQLAAGVTNMDFPEQFYSDLALRAVQIVRLTSRWDKSLHKHDSWTYVQECVRGLQVASTGKSPIKVKEAKLIKKKADLAASLERSCRVVEYMSAQARSNLVRDLYEVQRMVNFQQQLLKLNEPMTEKYRTTKRQMLELLSRMKDEIEKTEDVLWGDENSGGQTND